MLPYTNLHLRPVATGRPLSVMEMTGDTMRFVATLKHSTENCWAREQNEQKAQEWLGEMDHRAADAGVKIDGTYVCPNEHTFYFILQADSFEGVSSFLGPPLLTDHDALIAPVITFDEAERAVRE